MKKILFSLLLCLAIQSKLSAQDFMFSQYYAAQSYLNPAMTGFFDGSYRLNAIYRTQSPSINNGISTYGVNGEFKLGAHEMEGDYFGIGLSVFRDDIYKRVQYNSGRFNMAFAKKLGYGETKHFLSIGTNLGMDYKQVPNNFRTPTPGVDETPPKDNAVIPNLGLGANYQIIFPSFANVFFGAAVDHLISDDVSIFNNNVQAKKRYTMYSMARLEAGKQLFLLPTLLVINQASSRQINFGVSSQFLMRDYNDYKTNLQLGINARMGNEGFDALIGLVRYETRGVQIGLSYDHTLTELSSANGGFGALEFSIGYIGFIRRVIMSRAECPNLKAF